MAARSTAPQNPDNAYNRDRLQTHSVWRGSYKVFLTTNCTSGIAINTAKQLYITGIRMSISTGVRCQEKVGATRAIAKLIVGTHTDIKNTRVYILTKYACLNWFYRKTQCAELKTPRIRNGERWVSLVPGAYLFSICVRVFEHIAQKYKEAKVTPANTTLDGF